MQKWNKELAEPVRAAGQKQQVAGKPKSAEESVNIPNTANGWGYTLAVFEMLCVPNDLERVLRAAPDLAARPANSKFAR